MKLPDGWLQEDEAKELQRLAKGKTVLELGAWKGRSTVALASVAEYVVSVDRHHGIPGHDADDSLDHYLQAVRGLSNVAIVIADFQRIVPLLSSFFDMVYVDGDHEEDCVWRDTQFALEKCSMNGLIAFHDWDFSSVRRGVARVLGDRLPENVVGSVASFEVM